MSAVLPPPYTYGLPAHFSAWRPSQAEAVTRAVASTKRITALVAPTGFGKTITAATIAKFIGGRSCYNVETKALMEQIERELSGVYTTIKGRGNYDCVKLLNEGAQGLAAKCDRSEGACNTCALQTNGCHYFDTQRRAGKAEMVLTNYSYWLSINRYNENALTVGGDFDLLINDEAHNAPEQLSKFLRIEITAREIEQHLREQLPPAKPTLTQEEWIGWAARRVGELRARLDAWEVFAKQHELTSEQSKEMRELARLSQAVSNVAGMRGVWIEDRDWRLPNTAVAFEPLWPGAYIEELTQHIPRVLFMSATIRPKTLELLGFAPADYDFLEFPSSFPIARRPVISIPTVAQRNTMTPGQKIEAIRRLDQIIDMRLDRKGIVHTVSFDRAKEVLEHSRHHRRMMINESRNTISTIERFKRAPMGTILVTPSADTGWDFPGDQCEYQVILKVPFPDTRSPVMAARSASDPTYTNFLAMTKVVQMAGRGMRFAGDSCETLVIDDNWASWFLRRNRQFAPAFFLGACRHSDTIPRPPAKLVA